MSRKLILSLTFPLVFLILIVSSAGLFTPGFYDTETTNWAVQAVGQDLINLLLVVPALAAVILLLKSGVEKISMLWAGVMLYTAYTFTLYCFNVHFNRMFPGYCLCLGISFYSILYYLYWSFSVVNANLHSVKLIKFTGYYFIVIALLFYILWLSDIIPAIINNSIPQNVIDTGLFTNGVQVLDLSIILPAVFICGILILRKKSTAYLMAPVLLTFFIIMDLTIGALAFLMKVKGVSEDISVVYIMATLAILSSYLLYRVLKEIRITSSHLVVT